MMHAQYELLEKVKTGSKTITVPEEYQYTLSDLTKDLRKQLLAHIGQA